MGESEATGPTSAWVSVVFYKPHPTTFILLLYCTERPEEEYDHRTLYERLKEQKDKKQEEFLEQFKFSTYIFNSISCNHWARWWFYIMMVFCITENMIYKGLDDEEAHFLTFIAQRRADQETEMIKREIEEVHSFRVMFC